MVRSWSRLPADNALSPKITSAPFPRWLAHPCDRRHLSDAGHTRHKVCSNSLYGWHCPGRIFFPKVVTFFETLAVVFEHFLHWVTFFNCFFWSIWPVGVRKTNFQTRHLMLGTWKLPPNMGGFEVFSHFFSFCIIFLCFRIKPRPSQTFIL